MEEIIEIKQNFRIIFDQIHTIFQRKNLNEIQSSIQIKQQIIALKSEFKSMLLRLSSDTKKETDILEQVLIIFTDFFNEEQQFLKNNLIKYEIQRLYINIIVVLLQSWGIGGELRVRGSVNALASILLGISNPSIENVLVKPNHPEYASRYNLVFHYLDNYAGLYYEASCQIYAIHSNNFHDWAEIALEGNKILLDKILNSWNLTEHFQMSKKLNKEQNFHNDFRIVLAVYAQMIRYLILLYARCGLKWPKEIKNPQFVDISSPRNFINSLKEIYLRIENLLKDYTQNINIGIFDINFDPLNQPRMKFTLRNVRSLGFVIKGIDLMVEYTDLQNTSLNSDINSSDCDSIKNRFSSLIEGIIEYLKSLSILMLDEKFLPSEEAELLAERFRYFISLATIYSKLIKNIEPLLRMKNVMGVFLSKNGKQRYPMLNFCFTVGKISIAADLHDFNTLESASRELIQLSEFLLYQERDSFAAYLLGKIILIILGKESEDKVIKDLEDKLKISEKFIQTDLINEIKNYLQNIRDILKGSEISISKKRLNHFFAFDPISYITPTISGLSGNTNLLSLEYFPFNLAKLMFCI